MRENEGKKYTAAERKKMKAAQTEALADALEMQKYLKAKQKTAQEIQDVLVPFMEEFLSGFVVIGYGVDGQPVNIVRASNMKDLDALSTNVDRFYHVLAPALFDKIDMDDIDDTDD